jgi:hypothetical protein
LAAWHNKAVGDSSKASISANDLTAQELAHALHGEDVWRRAETIVASRPTLDVSDVYHALRTLELPPAERLRLGLTRVRFRPHAR